jgi:hypothetical protein
MAALETETCRFRGCERPVEAAAETVGRPPRYCELPEHNAQTAFRERRRRAASGELDGDDHDWAGGERPVSLAIASIGSLAKRLAEHDRARSRAGMCRSVRLGESPRVARSGAGGDTRHS